MVIYCISDFEFCGDTLPTTAIRSFQSLFRVRWPSQAGRTGPKASGRSGAVIINSNNYERETRQLHQAF